MSGYDFDLFVIGAGSGGTRAARIAAGYGARVGVAEERFLGGTCVNVGCVPKKLFFHASHFRDEFEDAAGYGWTVGERSFDWATFIERKDREISRLNDVYRRLIEGAGARIFEARAVIVAPHTVEVGGRRYTAEHILVATGGRSLLPEIPGVELGIDSDAVFHLPEQPREVLIVGGGYIAVEFAGIFNGLGTGVTQLYRGPLFLRGFDAEIRSCLAEEMAGRGVDLRFHTNVRALERAGRGRVRAHLVRRERGGEWEDAGTLEVDQVLFAIGRAPNVEGLGLERLGVDMRENGAVVVDEYSRSSVPWIYAIGDVTDRVNLTPVAIREGHLLAETLFNANPCSPDHRDIPTAVFSQPPLGTCGLTEEEAAARHSLVDVYVSRFRPMKHTLSGREERMVMKLLVERESDRVLGCHILGHEGPELIQLVGVAIKCEATKARFDATIGVHPTAAEELVTMRTPERTVGTGAGEEARTGTRG